VKQFSQANLVQQIDRILRNMDLNGKNLKLEITESALIHNPESTRELLDELRARQIQLCIDDFGTGYSSLNYLHQFSIDILKIDQSFVRHMSVKNEDSEIVRTIISLAQNLSVEVIAEGIETPEQLIQLKQLGCRYGQGYLFAKPLDSQAIELLIAEQKNRYYES
jgi:EAL domain-containing protein (putative c-di-GMP-specific phosphodiesterase class I)